MYSISLFSYTGYHVKLNHTTCTATELGITTPKLAPHSPSVSRVNSKSHIPTMTPPQCWARPQFYI